MRILWKVIFCIAIFSIAQLAISQTPPRYTVTELHPDIKLRSNSGAFVRVTETFDGSGSLNHWHMHTTLKVESQGQVQWELTSDDRSKDVALAVNDNGTVVGSRDRYIVTSHTGGLMIPVRIRGKAAIFSNGTATIIHDAAATAFGLDTELSESSATDINNAGEVVGTISHGNQSFGFLYKDGAVTKLGEVSGVDIATAQSINDFGQITGQVRLSDRRAYVYSDGHVRALDTPDPVSSASSGRAMNSAGQMIGYWWEPMGSSTIKWHAFLYQGGAFTEIDAPRPDAGSMFVNDINNAGIAVGQYALMQSPDHAFIYRDGQAVDLNSMVGDVAAILKGGFLSRAQSINDDGVIVANVANSVVGRALLTPTQPAATDSAIFNFEDGTQGWESSGEPIITVAKSTAQKFAGESSLGIQFNDDGFAAVRVLYPSVQPGHTVTYRLYLPADSTLAWIQPFAQGGGDGNWEWHGNWMSAEGLQLGAWNTVTLEIPEGAQPLYSLGLELFAESNAGTVYLDSVDYGSTQDTAEYNFEAGTQDWQSFRDPIVTLASSTAQEFAGKRSLSVAINGTGLATVGVENPSVDAGDTVTFRVYLPADANIDWIQPFAIEGAAGGWAWHGNWQAIEALQLGAWNTIAVSVPATATPIAAIGVELSVSESYTGTVFVDSVDF